MKRSQTAFELERNQSPEEIIKKAVEKENTNFKRQNIKHQLKYGLIWALVTMIGMFFSSNYILRKFFEVQSQLLLVGYFDLFVGLALLYGAYAGGTRNIFPAMAYSGGIQGVKDDMINQRRLRFTQLGLPLYGIIIGTLLIIMGYIFE